MAMIQERPASADEAYRKMQRVIWKVAHKFAKNNKQDFDDLVQWGAHGLMIAYNRWDPARVKGAWSSYAYLCIWTAIKDYAVIDWKVYNNTSGQEINDEVMGIDGYELSLEDQIDLERKYKAMDSLDRQIAEARAEGYSFKEIAEGLNQLGHNFNLHQVRNRFMAAIA